MIHQPPPRTGGQGSARIQRKFQILSILAEALDNANMIFGTYADFDDAGWMSTGQIARRCGLRSSPHLRGILDELLAKGNVKVKAEVWRTNMPVYMWRINESTRDSEEWKAAFDVLYNPDAVLS